MRFFQSKTDRLHFFSLTFFLLGFNFILGVFGNLFQPNIAQDITSSTSFIENTLTNSTGVKVGFSLFLVLIIPIFEEFSFRFWIRDKFDWLTIISFGLFLTFTPFYTFGIPIFLIVYTLLVMFCLLFKKIDYLKTQLDFNQNKPYFIVLSSLLFAFGHFDQFQNITLSNPNFFGLAIIFTFLGFGTFALGLTYIRTKFGFWYAILAHSIANFIASIALFIDFFSQFEIIFVVVSLVLLGALVAHTMIFTYQNLGKLGKIQFPKNIFGSLIIFTIVLSNILYHSNQVFLQNQKQFTEYGLGGYYADYIENTSLQPKTVAIIDTPAFLEHSAFVGKNIKNTCLIENCSCEVFGNCEHGTGILGVVSFLTPRSHIWLISAIDPANKTNQFNFVKSLELIEKSNSSGQKIDVVNISANTSDVFEGSCDSFDIQFTDIAKKVTAQGTKIFVSTGNDNQENKIAFPACVNSVIPVTCVKSKIELDYCDKANRGGNFSNLAKAIGNNLTIPSIDSVTKKELTKVSGTSFSTAAATAQYLHGLSK